MSGISLLALPPSSATVGTGIGNAEHHPTGCLLSLLQSLAKTLPSLFTPELLGVTLGTGASR